MREMRIVFIVGAEITTTRASPLINKGKFAKDKIKVTLDQTELNKQIKENFLQLEIRISS